MDSGMAEGVGLGRTNGRRWGRKGGGVVVVGWGGRTPVRRKEAIAYQIIVGGLHACQPGGCTAFAFYFDPLGGFYFDFISIRSADFISILFRFYLDPLGGFRFYFDFISIYFGPLGALHMPLYALCTPIYVHIRTVNASIYVLRYG